jgi:hypothetical protein
MAGLSADTVATNSNRLAGRIGVCGVHPGGVPVPENRPGGGYHETAGYEFQGDRGRVGRCTISWLAP